MHGFNLAVGSQESECPSFIFLNYNRVHHVKQAHLSITLLNNINIIWECINH